MKGSEKQVKWAEKIRAQLIEEARHSYDVYKNQCDIAPKKVMELFERAAVKLCAGHEEATWWIDHRSDSVLAEIDTIVEELYTEE